MGQGAGLFKIGTNSPSLVRRVIVNHKVAGSTPVEAISWMELSGSTVSKAQRRKHRGGKGVQGAQQGNLGEKSKKI